MCTSMQRLGRRDGAGFYDVCAPCPVDEGVQLERSCRQANELLAMGILEPQAQRVTYDTGLG